jgi:hypothetical protein
MDLSDRYAEGRVLSALHTEIANFGLGLFENQNFSYFHLIEFITGATSRKRSENSVVLYCESDWRG